MTRCSPSNRYWNVVRAEHVQDHLPVFFAARERPADLRMSGEDLGSCDDCVRDSRRQLRRLACQEGREPVKIGERVLRPLQLYLACHG
jgi:hypothetical protein